MVSPLMFFQTHNGNGRIPSRNSPPPSASELASLRLLAFFYLLIGGLDLLGAAGLGLTNLNDPVFRTVGLAGSAIAVLLLLSGWSMRFAASAPSVSSPPTPSASDFRSAR